MKINAEKKYLLLMGVPLLLIYILLFSLLNKYYGLTISHFVSQCKITFAAFLESKIHLAGLTIVSLIIATSIALLLKMVFSYLKTKRKLNRFLKQKNNSKYSGLIVKLAGNLDINSDQIIIIKTKKHIAFSYGIIKPKVLISNGLVEDLSEKELEAVMIHEIYHIENYHVFIFIFIEAFKSLLFFIPIGNSLAKKIKLTLETNADQKTVLFQGTDKHLRYALANTLSQKQNFAFLPNFSTIHIEQRIEILLDKKVSSKFRKTELVVSFLILFSLVVMYFFPTFAHANTDYLRALNAESCKQMDNMSPLSVNMTPKL